MFRICTILLATLALGACASAGAKPEPFPRPASRPPPDPGPPTGLAAPLTAGSVTATALSLRGAPYRDGGSDPSGFDCSGFVWYVFARNGIPVPRTVEELFGQAVPVSRTSMRAGDLVFFDTSGQGVSHVGIALGTDEFVHAPSSRGGVRIERIGGTYWAGRFRGARRIR
jgi:cell wall-associated NlpC family hydrolase